MKKYSPLPVVMLTLTCGFAYLPAAAQSTAPSGSYGFVAAASQVDSDGGNGAALVGLLTFDGAGSVTGTATAKGRSPRPQKDQAIPANITGTYSSNPDGTGSLTLNLDVGFSVTLTTVATDGGQGYQLVGPGCSFCGADVPFQGQASSLTATLPIGLALQGATGNVPLSFTGVTGPRGGITVYTAGAATGSGTAQCPDGSAGTWTADVPTATLAVNPDVPSAATNGGPVSGNFFAAVIGSVCGAPDFETIGGLVTGAVSAGGATSLSLHSVTGAVISGVARAAKGGSLNGSYGVQLNFLPFPTGAVGIMKFDGAGNVSVSLTVAGGTANASTTAAFTGTYSINSDSSGTMNLKSAGQSSGPTYAFVVTDGGSQLLLLRTDANPGFDVSYGTARLQ